MICMALNTYKTVDGHFSAHGHKVRDPWPKTYIDVKFYQMLPFSYANEFFFKFSLLSVKV